MKKSLNPIDLICWFMFLVFGIVATVEFTNVLTPSTGHAAHTGAMIGFGWFATMALLFAAVPVLRVVRTARAALSARVRTLKLDFGA